MITRRLFLLAFAALSTVVAQDENKLKTTLVMYAPADLPQGFTAFFQNGGEILEFKADSGGLSVPIRYEGPRRFILRDSIEAFAAAPDKMKPPVAMVDLPENCSNVLLLAAPVAGGKLRLIPYDVAPNNLGAGEYKFFNFSHSIVSVILDKQKFTISPSEDKVIKDPSWKGEPKAFSLKIATVKDNKATLINETMWEHWPEKRQVVFFFNGRRKSEPVGFMCFNLGAPLRPTEPR